jgi:hypothetical protein
LYKVKSEIDKIGSKEIKRIEKEKHTSAENRKTYDKLVLQYQKERKLRSGQKIDPVRFSEWLQKQKIDPIIFNEWLSKKK